MNAYLLNPELHKHFGDRLVAILHSVSESIGNDDVYPIYGALRAWTQTWIGMQKFSSRDYFDSSMFVQRVSALKHELAPLSKLLTQLCLKIEHQVIELLAREGTAGNTHCVNIISLCTYMLMAGSLMHTTCLTLGSDKGVELDTYMNDVNKQVDKLRRDIKLTLKQFEGSYLVPAPQTPVALAHVRSWLSFMTLAVSIHIAVDSQPQQLITVLMENHPVDVLLRKMKRLVRCLETMCRDIDTPFQQVNETTPVVTINPVGVRNIDEDKPWVVAGRIWGPKNDDSVVKRTLQERNWYKKMSKRVHDVSDVAKKSELYDNMNKWSYDDWAEFTKSAGLATEEDVYPDKTKFKPFQAPEDMFLGALISDMNAIEEQKSTSSMNTEVIKLIDENERLNIPPEVKERNKKTIMDLYNRAKDEKAAKLPMDPRKLKAWMDSQNAGIIANNINEKFKLPQEPRQPSPQSAPMAPMDEGDLLTAFSQESVMTTEELIANIREGLEGDFTQKPEDSQDSGPPPLIRATMDLLGDDPTNTQAVVLTNAGPTDLPVNVRSLSAFVCVAMLIYPASDKLLGYDSFMSRVKECSQKISME
jgi:hypothetical protein